MIPREVTERLEQRKLELKVALTSAERCEAEIDGMEFVIEAWKAVELQSAKLDLDTTLLRYQAEPSESKQ